MNTQTRRAVRFVLALIASFQVAVAAGGPWLDALFERRARDAIAHVESSTASTCAPVHDHDLCALCRDLGRSKLPTQRAAPMRLAHVVVTTRADRPDADGDARFEIPLGSRAPPRA